MAACDCQGCISKGTICAPKGDDTRVLFSVFDDDGDEYDISGATEIVFIVADSPNGEIRIVKRLTPGGVVISTNGYQFHLMITASQSASLPKGKRYYEAQITTSTGLKKTVSQGVFRATETRIKDLP